MIIIIGMKKKLLDYLQNSKNIFFANLTLRHCRRIFNVSQLNVPGNLHLERFTKRSHSEVTKLQKEKLKGCDFLIFVYKNSNKSKLKTAKLTILSLIIK